MKLQISEIKDAVLHLSGLQNTGTVLFLRVRIATVILPVV
jgi:hypothetical protein